MHASRRRTLRSRFRPVRRLVPLLLVALTAGCTSDILAHNARSSLADFIVEVFADVVEVSINPPPD